MIDVKTKGLALLGLLPLPVRSQILMQVTVVMNVIYWSGDDPN